MYANEKSINKKRSEKVDDITRRDLLQLTASTQHPQLNWKGGLSALLLSNTKLLMFTWSTQSSTAGTIVDSLEISDNVLPSSLISLVDYVDCVGYTNLELSDGVATNR